MATISLRAGPENKARKKGPKGAIMIEPWRDCFGGPAPARLRVNGKLVGEVNVDRGSFWITTQRKWVAKVLGEWLGLPIKRRRYGWGHVEWSVQGTQ